jgi:hypothetical protein
VEATKAAASTTSAPPPVDRGEGDGGADDGGRRQRGRVRAPLLLVLGLKDKRVPASQGVEYLHVARAQGLNVRCVVVGVSV